MQDTERRTQNTGIPFSYVFCVLIAAVVFFLAACEGGDPTSVGACAGATFTAPSPTQPTGALPISPTNITFKWTAAVPDTGFEVKHYVVRIDEGSACSGGTVDTSGELTATSYTLSGNLKSGILYAWEIEATLKETAGTAECEVSSDCSTFITQ